MKTIFVCGHGRCGSSLVMQMLSAGGYPCYGERPAFEPEDVGFERSPCDLLPRVAGMAVKILDPQLTEWGELPNVSVIWMDRDRNEQAKSQVKFLRIIGGMGGIPRSAWKTFASSYGPDTAASMELFRERAVPVIRMAFESLIQNPSDAAIAIQSFTGADLNVGSMASVVLPRDIRCRPDCDIELSLCAGIQQ